MNISERQIQDRFGSALYRLAALERKISEARDPGSACAKLLDDVRKLAGELTSAFTDVQEVLAHYADLRQSSATASRRAAVLFDLSPVACLLTDVDGVVLNANAPAVRLLNVSQRHLIGRGVHLFVGADREGFLARLQGLDDGRETDQWQAVLRPRERCPFQATVIAALDEVGRVILMILKPEATFAALGAIAAEAPIDASSVRQ